MKRNFKKVLLSALFLSLATTFAACGDDDDDEGSSDKGMSCECLIDYADPGILAGPIETYNMKNWKGKCSDIKWTDLPFQFGVYYQEGASDMYTLECK
ncbi:MAG: hypothetical protein IJ748_03765 [Bacteroidales bacterium]|nr:hypothetical protein [Bacteroidales bacterium]